MPGLPLPYRAPAKGPGTVRTASPQGPHTWNRWLQQPLTRMCSLEGWRSLRHSEESVIITSLLTFWFTNSLPAGLRNYSWRRSPRVQEANEAQVVVSGRHQPVCYPCQTCNHYGKRDPASTPCAWRSCLGIHYDGKHFILKTHTFSFSLLQTVLKVRIHPPPTPTWCQRYLSTWMQVGKIGDKIR